MNWKCPKCKVPFVLCPGEGKVTEGRAHNLKCSKCGWFYIIDTEGAVLIEHEEPA